MADKVTGQELWDFCLELVEKKAGYVWGARGKEYTEAERDFLYNNYRSTKYNKTYYYTTQWKRWNGRIVVDCSGMIQAFRIAKLDGKDSSADALYENSPQKGEIDTLPKNKRGVLVFVQGSDGNMNHVGTYGGDGTTIESKDSAKGVVHLSLDKRWTHWGIPAWCTPVDIKSADVEIGYVVTANTLNVRDLPDSKKGKVLRVLKADQRVAAYEAKGDWVRIHPEKDEWTSAKYLRKLPLYEVTASSLYLRKSPSTNGTVVKTLKKGDDLYVFDYEGNWYLVDPVNNFWASKSYVKVR